MFNFGGCLETKYFTFMITDCKTSVFWNQFSLDHIGDNGHQWQISDSQKQINPEIITGDMNEWVLNTTTHFDFATEEIDF